MEQKFYNFVKTYISMNSVSLADQCNSRVSAAIDEYISFRPNQNVSVRKARKPGPERTRLAKAAAQALVDHNWNNVNHPLVALFRG